MNDERLMDDSGMLGLAAIADPGSSFKDNFERASSLAVKLDCFVLFEYKGRVVRVYPHTALKDAADFFNSH